MQYELRELKSTDLGMVCKLLSKVGIKEFKNSLNVEDYKKKTEEEMSISVMFDVGCFVVERLPKVQGEIDKFISSVAGIDQKEISEMNFADYGELVMNIFLKEEFKDFFARAMKLLKI